MVVPAGECPGSSSKQTSYDMGRRMARTLRMQTHHHMGAHFSILLATSSVIARIFISDWRCSPSALASSGERAPGGLWRRRYSPGFARRACSRLLRLRNYPCASAGWPNRNNFARNGPSPLETQAPRSRDEWMLAAELSRTPWRAALRLTATQHVQWFREMHVAASSCDASWWAAMLPSPAPALPERPGQRRPEEWLQAQGRDSRRRESVRAQKEKSWWPGQRRPEEWLQARGRDSRRRELGRAQLVRARMENLPRRAAPANCAPGGQVRPRCDGMQRRNPRTATARRSRLQAGKLPFSTLEMKTLRARRLQDATMQDAAIEI